jgi:hypothetical protein
MTISDDHPDDIPRWQYQITIPDDIIWKNFPLSGQYLLMRGEIGNKKRKTSRREKAGKILCLANFDMSRSKEEEA